MEEKIESLTEFQSLERRPSAQVDFIFYKGGADSAWVDKLLSQERVSDRLKALKSAKSSRKIGIVVGTRGPSSHEIEAETPEIKISPELTPGDYLIFLPEDFLTRGKGNTQTILIHEIAHLRKGLDDIDRQLIKNKQEVGRFLEANPSLNAEAFALLGIAGYIFNYLIDYRLSKWQIGQGELQDALELADRAKRSYKRDVSRREKLEKRSIKGKLSLGEALEAYRLDLCLVFNVYDVYLGYFAPFESLPEVASKRGEDLVKLFEKAKTIGHYITDNSLTSVLNRAKEIAGLVDSGVADKEKILETVFGKELLGKIGASKLLQSSKKSDKI